MIPLAVVLAALGACGYAFGARLQHAAVRATMDGGGLGLRNQAQLVRSPRWLAGLAALGAGAVLHVCALGLAPLSVVQPVGVLALPITVLLNLREQGYTRRDVKPSMVLAVLAATGGLAVFVLLAAGSATPTPVGDDDQFTASQIVALAVVVLGVVAAATRSKVRCVLFAAGCAVAYGYVSLMARAVAQQVGTWDLLSINLLSVLGIAVAMVVGGWLLQHGYASGPPDLVMACLTVIDPLVAVGLGVGLLGEADHVSGWVATAEVLCALVACAGVFALARHHPDTTERRTSETLEEALPGPDTPTTEVPAGTAGHRTSPRPHGSSS
ncbi:hypothetical protein EIL87_15135 [Saccharopolyspora rhizosphaerae]|uniref:Multidrug DMT transporter permease n=1 Tax=Saccharopolyspora rhizosphaerae TaxID=2492662 RepID=A0A426JQE0_9PSEU|nr:hypothetical protein [Saccharopolyspora rhizosphaerae]RRO15398.1 hypothetical protein EIL87_15135 [Saccharopolyspora rhizosphaerae]